MEGENGDTTNTHEVPVEYTSADKDLRRLFIQRRRALIIELIAIEDFLGLPRSVRTKKYQHKCA